MPLVIAILLAVSILVAALSIACDRLLFRACVYLAQKVRIGKEEEDVISTYPLT